MARIIFITGTDTGVGKTIVTGTLLRHLRDRGINALAMKPFCTGDRTDVRILQRLQAGELTDSEMNPFFFRAPLAPYVAAKMQKKSIRKEIVMGKIARVARRCDVLLIEGAGGVMVPLGDKYLIADLIGEMRPKVVLVCPNKLGAINHALSAVSVLRERTSEPIVICLKLSSRPDLASATNAKTIKHFCSHSEVILSPFLSDLSVGYSEIPRGQKKFEKALAASVQLT